MVNDIGIMFILIILAAIPVFYFVLKKKEDKTNASRPTCNDDTCWWRK